MVSKSQLHFPDRAALRPYEGLDAALRAIVPRPSANAIGCLIRDRFAPRRHGRLEQWLQALEALPNASATLLSLDTDVVTVGKAQDLSPGGRQKLHEALMHLVPWRKGPLALFGTRIESEWRSDLKWKRLAREITPLEGRTVLDVGASNGYYAWRMAGAGARLVLGVDPTLLYVAQYLAFARYLRGTAAFVIPLRAEELPEPITGFDTVFSMGVLYHQREPIEHLRTLRRMLRPEGELALETLVMTEGPTLRPRTRYARMRNVWAIPTLDALCHWLAQTGFDNVRVIDVTRTTSEEQRRTAWMPFESLAEALDPNDPHLTVEGHPAPQRAIVLARK